MKRFLLLEHKVSQSSFRLGKEIKEGKKFI